MLYEWSEEIIMNINFTCTNILDSIDSKATFVEEPCISFLPLKLFFVELEPGTSRLIKFMAQCGEFLP